MAQFDPSTPSDPAALADAVRDIDESGAEALKDYLAEQRQATLSVFLEEARQQAAMALEVVEDEFGQPQLAVIAGVAEGQDQDTLIYYWSNDFWVAKQDIPTHPARLTGPIQVTDDVADFVVRNIEATHNPKVMAPVRVHRQYYPLRIVEHSRGYRPVVRLLVGQTGRGAVAAVARPDRFRGGKLIGFGNNQDHLIRIMLLEYDRTGGISASDMRIFTKGQWYKIIRQTAKSADDPIYRLERVHSIT